MFENIINFFKNIRKADKKNSSSKDTAKERLHLVLMQDRANVSADFLDLMKQEIIEVIKKYIDVDESAIDVRMTNKQNEDGTNGAPALYANIPIINIKDDVLKEKHKEGKTVDKEEENIQKEKSEVNKVEEEKKEEKKEESIEEKKTEKNTDEKNEPLEENETVKATNKQ